MHCGCIHGVKLRLTRTKREKGTGIHAQNLPSSGGYCVIFDFIPSSICCTNKDYERSIGSQKRNKKTGAFDEKMFCLCFV